jgi:outer membrane protein assembly factor BamB
MMMKSHSAVWAVVTLAGCLLLLSSSSTASAALLVGNTRGSAPISLYDDDDGGTFTPFLPSEVGDLLIAPDHLVIMEDMLYVSHGDTLNTSAIFRMNLTDGSYDPMWATAPDELYRPYGFAFDNDSGDDGGGVMYVASFLSDQILMFEQETGEYMGQFAAGDGTEEGLCNGPNQIAIHDGSLYLTTQGSVAGADGNLEYLFPSQIVVYDLETAEAQVYIEPPELLEGSLGYVSMLGIMIDCGEEAAAVGSSSNCTMYTTDFGGGLRAYDLETADLLYAAETTIDGASTGSLTLTEDGMIVIPIFADETSGSLLQFDALTGAPMGSTAGSPVLVGPTTDLARPVGVVTYMAEEEVAGAVPSDAPAGSEQPVETPTAAPVEDVPSGAPMGEEDAPTAAPTTSGAVGGGMTISAAVTAAAIAATTTFVVIMALV